MVTFHVIKMHSNKDTFSILLGRPWLRLADAIVDWGGAKPSITYGPEDNKVKVPIGSLGGWIREEIVSSSEDERDAKEDGKNDEALVGVVHSGSLGPSFYNYGDDGEYAQWLRDYQESEFDIMTTSHHACLRDDIFDSRSEKYSLLKSCEVLTEEEWILGGLTPWVDNMEESDVSLVRVDGTQDEDAIMEMERLEESLYFKTTSTGIVVGQDVKDYSNVPADWYRNKDEQVHVTEGDWKYVDVTIKNGKMRQMKMGCQLGEEYSDLVDEFSDTFAWSYNELKSISREMVEHHIPLIPGARPIRQNERMMNPRLQLLVKAELERLLNAGFIKPVEITDSVSPMVLVKKKNGKLRVCVNYKKLNACTQNDHFSLPFISLSRRGRRACSLDIHGWLCGI